MICVSINERTADGCIKAAEGLELAEIRMDLLEPSELSPGSIRRIFSQPSKLVATCRPGRIGEAKRKECLLLAIDAGAKYVDVEVEAPDAFKKEVVERARARGCAVIVSYHDHKRTPPEAELRQIVDWCFDSGADIAKIACMAESRRDCARLLGLLDRESKVIVIGMGSAGGIVRIAAPLLGSPFTYASSGKGKETAEGQMDRERMSKAMKGLEEALR